MHPLLNALKLQRLLSALSPQVPVVQLPAPIEPQTPAAAPAEPPAAAAAPQWHALPGDIIELGTTGFSIQLDTRAKRPLYTLRAPEGWIHGWGSDLPGLKRMGERYAAERAEFVFHGQWWKP